MKSLASRLVPRGLSARLLLLTIAFVILADASIYAPSIARYRLAYLRNCTADAFIASLALVAPPDNRVSDELGRELLVSARSYGLVLRRPDSHALVLSREMPHETVVAVDLRENDALSSIGAALATLAGDGRRMLRILAPSPRDADVVVETLVDEAPVRAAMIAHSQRILSLSVAISLIATVLLYACLQMLVVRPVKRLTESLIAFRDDPENPAASIVPSGRFDEIGRAQRELAHMQERLLAALRQRQRLAQLGAAMAKINHDLRNILASAQLVSDTVSESDDPKVKRVAPTVLGAIDRAIALCTQTLTFASGSTQLPVRRPFALKGLVDEVFEIQGAGTARKIAWANRVDPAWQVVADRGQVFRVLTNLTRNAVEAGANAIAVEAGAARGVATIDFIDDGPGLAPRALERLFQPFAGSARPGGTGLGLAIARELMRAHGGDIELAGTGATGTRFRLALPHVAVEAATPAGAAIRRLRPRGDDAINRA